MTPQAGSVAEWIAPLACCVAAVLDVRGFRVPNRLTAPLLLAGLVMRVWAGGGAGLVAGLLGAGAGFAALVGCYAAGAMGAGDVKLGAAVGAWLGAPATLEALLVAALASGVYALLLRLATGGVAGAVGALLLAAHDPGALLGGGRDGGVERRLRAADRRRHLVPFAAMLAAGVLAVRLGWA